MVKAKKDKVVMAVDIRNHVLLHTSWVGRRKVEKTIEKMSYLPGREEEKEEELDHSGRRNDKSGYLE